MADDADEAGGEGTSDGPRLEVADAEKVDSVDECNDADVATVESTVPPHLDLRGAAEAAGTLRGGERSAAER